MCSVLLKNLTPVEVSQSGLTAICPVALLDNTLCHTTSFSKLKPSLLNF